MTLFPNRYRVRVIGKDGLVHSDTADHILTLQPTAFLLKKNVRGGVREVRFIDTWRNAPVPAAELHAEALEGL
ncbi:MAG: hypothetical protein RLZZ234_590 [Candidatus Parcubacteria bacterium]|jgi:hypothetical protein